MKSLSKNKETVFGFLLITLIYLGLNFGLIRDHLNSDFFFHLGITQQLLEEGFISAIPQVEDTSWSKRFFDKEWMYHYLSAGAFLLGGEEGIVFLSRLLGLLTYLLLFWILFKISGKPGLAFFLTLLALLEYRLFQRVSWVRPATVSILFYLGMLASIYFNRKWTLWILCFLYPLFYHTVYIPAFMLFIMLLSIGENRKNLTIALACILGGVLVHPYSGYFNFIIHILSMGAVATRIPIHEMPLEFASLPIARTWHFHLVSIYTVLLGTWAFKNRILSGKNARFFYSLAALSVFWGLVALKQPRAFEYHYMPALIALIIPFKAFNLPLPKIAAAMALLFFSHLYTHSFEPNPSPKRTLEEAISFVPEGKKILNCNWTDGSVIYARGQTHRFVDMLNPYQLFEEAPLKSRLRSELILGDVLDPTIAVEVFRADYILCESWYLNQQLERDPNFQRVFPKGDLRVEFGGKMPIALYKAEKQFSSNFVPRLTENKQARYPAPIPTVESKKSRLYIQPSGCSNLIVDFKKRTDWIVFGGLSKIELLRPKREPIHLGGKSGIFTNAYELKGATQIHFEACSSEGTQTPFSVSQWTIKDLKKYCSLKTGKISIHPKAGLPGDLCHLVATL